jgi:adenosylcobinamide hydrolase
MRWLKPFAESMKHNIGVDLGAGSGFRTSFSITQQSLVIDLERRRRILSSAPRGGGFVQARYVINHQVDSNARHSGHPRPICKWGDPARYLGSVAKKVGVTHDCVGLMTAVPIRRLVVLREQEEGLWVEGFFTAGVTNAVRAGDWIGTEQEYGPGTINMVLVTNARLSRSAMVCAIQVTTEAKTAALFRAHVPCAKGKAGATGTGTDATVIVCGDGPSLKFSGTHTLIGMMMGRLVLRALHKGLRR